MNVQFLYKNKKGSDDASSNKIWCKNKSAIFRIIRLKFAFRSLEENFYGSLCIVFVKYSFIDSNLLAMSLYAVSLSKVLKDV